RLDRVVQRQVTRRTAQLVALRLAAGSPCDYRRLALRLQRPQTPLRPRRTHPNGVRPTVDHDPPTPSRITTGPPNGSPSRVQPQFGQLDVRQLTALGHDVVRLRDFRALDDLQPVVAKTLDINNLGQRLLA